MNDLSVFFNNLPISKKLTAGFGVVLLILVMLVGFIEIKLISQDKLQTRVIELRFPTNVAGHDLVNGINYSLAALRGYMILGKDTFKTQRKDAWHEIESNIAILTEMSKNWTVPENIKKLERLKDILTEFKLAQQKVEDISHTENEQPAMKILLNQAAPRAKKVMAAITELINEEKKQGATPKRKALLANFADSRGSFAMGLASIRAYLLSGNSIWADDFNKRWLVNAERLEAIKKSSHLLTSKQQKSFKVYVKMLDEFSHFPKKMFEIRGGKKWNMANYLLGTEAAPRAKEAFNILKAMVKNQNKLVNTDSILLKQQSTNIKVISIIATLIALVIGGFISWYITKIIVYSLNNAIATSTLIVQGDLSGKIEVSSNDETGKLLHGMKELQDKLIQVIEKDIQIIIDSAKNGDLSSRIAIDNKHGFYKKLSSSINELVNVNEQVVNDTVKMFSAMARGDLSQRIETSYQGAFNDLKADANQTVEKLTQVIEGDIQALVNSAKNGDLTQRINQNDKDGFFNTLSSGINELIDINEQVVNDTVSMFSAMAQGDLKQRISTGYQGSFNTLKQDANNTVEKLTQVIEGDIQKLIDAAKKGDLTQRISLDDKKGFFEALSTGVNDLVDVNERVINDTVRVMSSMTNGDLTNKIEGDYHGIFNQLKDDTNNTIDKLTEIIAGVTNSASLLGSASKELAMGNDDLSARTEQQAASLEETAASMEELAATVQENAQSAEHVDKLAKSAQQSAIQGGVVVNNAIKSMSEINSASKKIVDIINVIDEIAFQTNLLALNAAVEAARAGEQGRGFAVVAAEVRNLAQRSAGAAKEIKSLINNSSEKVDLGTKLVDESGEKLGQIVDSVKEVCDIISNIAYSAKEQTTGINQVNAAVSHMDGMTQRNAALVEQATAASRSVADQADEVNSDMTFFRINKNNLAQKKSRTNSKAFVLPTPLNLTSPKSKSRVTKVNNDNEWAEF